MTIIPVQAVTQYLKWIHDDVLSIPQKKKLRPLAREQLWAAYHTHLLANIPAMEKVVNRPAASFLSLQIMKKCLEERFCITADRSELNDKKDVKDSLTSHDQDVIEYISGFMLSKLQKKCPVICSGLHDKDQQSGTFLESLDRGGLKRPIKDYVAFVLELECIFRCLRVKSVSKSEFNQLVEKYDVSSVLLDILTQHEITASENEQEKFFCACINLFFKTRAHQKCRFLVEKQLAQKKERRNVKALRDILSR